MLFQLTSPRIPRHPCHAAAGRPATATAPKAPEMDMEMKSENDTQNVPTTLQITSEPCRSYEMMPSAPSERLERTLSCECEKSGHRTFPRTYACVPCAVDTIVSAQSVKSVTASLRRLGAHFSMCLSALGRSNNSRKARKDPLTKHKEFTPTFTECVESVSKIAPTTTFYRIWSCD